MTLKDDDDQAGPLPGSARSSISTWTLSTHRSSSGSIRISVASPCFSDTFEAFHDGPDARIKTSQLLAYGARLDLKLTEPADEPADILLQFLATAGKTSG